MKPKYFIFLCLSVYVLSTQYSTATVRYVSKTGTSTPPYTSWETSADSIQKCINICVAGDTIYVANGVYKEQVVMIAGLSLIGAGMDSCVIDTRDLATTQNFKALVITNNCLINGFKFLISHTPDKGIGIAGTGNVGNSLITLNSFITGYEGIYLGGSPMIYKNNFSDVSIGVEFFNSNGIVRSNIISTSSNSQIAVVAGIYLQAFDNSYSPLIDSNYIEVNKYYGIYKSFGTRPIIINNIMKLKGVGATGILMGYDSIFYKNNLIWAEVGFRGIDHRGYNSEIINNTITGNFNESILELSGDNIVKNNSITEGNSSGVFVWSNSGLVFQYNNVWNNAINYSGFAPDSTNISVDPMVVNNDTTQDELDFHLQMFSPLIDAGDPTMKDKDSSRIDIGLYGGLFGESYNYFDLPPRPPLNLTALVDTNNIILSWNGNTEADTAFYNVYRDTVINFTIDSTKLISSPTDTFFIQINPDNVTRFVYKVTCVDKQGNESKPSEEKVVDITGVEQYPQLITDYQLYQNFPNPFNPSTTINYRLINRGYVKLYVYDIKGELISVLINKEQDAGFYEVEFDVGNGLLSVPNSLASGVYIYQILIKSENSIPVFSDIKKMIYLK